jgi:hypothetical protein
MSQLETIGRLAEECREGLMESVAVRNPGISKSSPTSQPHNHLTTRLRNCSGIPTSRLSVVLLYQLGTIVNGNTKLFKALEKSGRID